MVRVVIPRPIAAPAAPRPPVHHWGRSLLHVVAAVLLVGPSMGCREETSSTAPEKLLACVTIPPQAYFARRVGGDHLRVEVLVGPGQSHHTYEPTPRQVAGLAQARLYFLIGLPLERALVERIAAGFGGLRMVDTTEGVPLLDGGACGAAGHDHDHDHGERGGEKDPHVWLNPRLVKVLARHMAAALRDVDPSHAGEYQQNLTAFEKDLDAADRKVAGKLAPYRGREFFVFHPAFGYFADAYGLKQVAVEEEGKEPTGRRLAQLIERARAAGARSIFVQPQFPVAGASAVAQAVGGRVVTLDPLAEDYLANLEEMADRIAAGFGAAAGAVIGATGQAERAE